MIYAVYEKSQTSTTSNIDSTPEYQAMVYSINVTKKTIKDAFDTTDRFNDGDPQVSILLDTSELENNIETWIITDGEKIWVESVNKDDYGKSVCDKPLLSTDESYLIIDEFNKRFDYACSR